MQAKITAFRVAFNKGRRHWGNAPLFSLSSVGLSQAVILKRVMVLFTRGVISPTVQ